MIALELYAQLWGVETSSLPVWYPPFGYWNPLTSWSGSHGRMSRFLVELKVHGTGQTRFFYLPDQGSWI